MLRWNRTSLIIVLHTNFFFRYHEIHWSILYADFICLHSRMIGIHILKFFTVLFIIYFTVDWFWFVCFRSFYRCLINCTVVDSFLFSMLFTFLSLPNYTSSYQNYSDGDKNNCYNYYHHYSYNNYNTGTVVIRWGWECSSSISRCSNISNNVISSGDSGIVWYITVYRCKNYT